MGGIAAQVRPGTVQAGGLDSGLGALSDGEREVVGLSPIAGGELSECRGDRVGVSISSRAGGGVTLVEGSFAFLDLAQYVRVLGLGEYFE